MAILDVQNIEKHFGATRVLEDISFSLEQGQALAIIGSSGSGKTTLLRCLNFLETPNQGKILVNGETLFDAADPVTQREAEVRKKRLHFGLVFQSFNLFPQYTALENVTLAPRLLAQEAAQVLGREAVPLLAKTGHNRPQSSLAHGEQRWKNVAGVYTVPHPEEVAGQRILLIDDILTTGATLNEAARTLRQAGAAQVVCATLCRTPSTDP